MHWVIETRENGKRSLLSHTQSALPSITSSSNSNGILKKTSLCNILCCASGHQRQPSTVAEAVSGPRYWKMQKTNTICVPNRKKKKNRIYSTLLGISWTWTTEHSHRHSNTNTRGAKRNENQEFIFYIAHVTDYTHL